MVKIIVKQTLKNSAYFYKLYHKIPVKSRKTPILKEVDYISNLKKGT